MFKSGFSNVLYDCLIKEPIIIFTFDHSGQHETNGMTVRCLVYRNHLSAYDCPHDRRVLKIKECKHLHRGSFNAAYVVIISHAGKKPKLFLPSSESMSGGG